MRDFMIAAVAAAALSSGSASAADIAARPYTKAPALAQVYNWTGFYIGGHVGYASSDIDYTFLAPSWYGPAAGNFGYSMDGAVAGGHIGYNWQTGAWVFGLEGSASWTDVKQGDVVSPFFPLTDRFSSRLEWMATVTPRLGYAFNNWLFYAKGGVAFASIKARIQDNVTLGGDFNERTTTQTGWTIGGGLEYAFAPNWILGVEGNYYDFGTFNVNQQSLLNSGAPAGVFSNHDVNTQMWSVLGRISYKFGSPAVIAKN